MAVENLKRLGSIDISVDDNATHLVGTMILRFPQGGMHSSSNGMINLYNNLASEFEQSF